jgi:hypothetical protein
LSDASEANPTRRPQSATKRLFLCVVAWIFCPQDPPAFGGSKVFGDSPNRQATESCHGHNFRDEKSFYIESADAREIVLFDEALPKAARICSEHTLDDNDLNTLRVNYAFSDGRTGHVDIGAGGCVDLFATRVGAKLECLEHNCKFGQFRCIDGTLREAMLHVTAAYAGADYENPNFERYLQPAIISRSGNIFVISEKSVDVEILGAPGFLISYHRSYPEIDRLHTKEMTLDRIFISGSLLKIEFPPFPSHPTFAYRVIYSK